MMGATILGNLYLPVIMEIYLHVVRVIRSTMRSNLFSENIVISIWSIKLSIRVNNFHKKPYPVVHKYLIFNSLSPENRYEKFKLVKTLSKISSYFSWSLSFFEKFNASLYRYKKTKLTRKVQYKNHRQLWSITESGCHNLE